MEIRRRCNKEGFYFEVKREEKPTYFFKNAVFNNNVTTMSVSKNGIDWMSGVKAPYGFSLIKNPFSIISDGRLVTQNDQGAWAVFDSYGKILIPYGKYVKIDGFNHRLARVKKMNTAIFWEEDREEYFYTFGIIDIFGREIVECEYDEIYKFYGTNNMFTILHKYGNPKIKFHLAYWRTFGSTRDVEDMQYDEDHGKLVRMDTAEIRVYPDGDIWFLG